MKAQIPEIGMRVMFGHMLLEGERTGTITEITLAGAIVAVDFLPEDGPENPPGKLIRGCYYSAERPEEIPDSRWQYCYPIPEKT